MLQLSNYLMRRLLRRDGRMRRVLRMLRVLRVRMLRVLRMLWVLRVRRAVVVGVGLRGWRRGGPRRGAAVCAAVGAVLLVVAARARPGHRAHRTH